ncbi:radical SAM enzyme, TIGR01210 family [Pelomyxa schiedti]|nr:radical SAM enzyme, TIGR01210 family [Pelomyxa schiedti]
MTIWGTHLSQNFVVFDCPPCRWGKCTSCALVNKPVPRKDTNSLLEVELLAQVNHTRDLLLERRGTVTKVIMSNNGSMLDTATFPHRVLVEAIRAAKLSVDRLDTICIESRPEYATESKLLSLLKVINEAPETRFSHGTSNTRLEIGIGVEVFDDDLRNNVLHKGLTALQWAQFLKLAIKLRVAVKMYFMLKPLPQQTTGDAIQDIHSAITFLHEFLSSQSEFYGYHQQELSSLLSIHVNPTFVPRGSVAIDKDNPQGIHSCFLEGTYKPPSLYDLACALRPAEGMGFSVYAGVWDEGLAEPGGSFLDYPGSEDAVRVFKEFNQSQDYSLLDKLISCS